MDSGEEMGRGFLFRLYIIKPFDFSLLYEDMVWIWKGSFLWYSVRILFQISFG